MVRTTQSRRLPNCLPQTQRASIMRVFKWHPALTGVVQEWSEEYRLLWTSQLLASRASKFYFILFHFSKCQSHVRQASVTCDQVLSPAFIASLPLNSPDLLCGRYCKSPHQCLLQHFLINPVVLRHQNAENYISHTPLQVRSYMGWCPPKHTPAPD